MEKGRSSTIALKKPTLTPKAIINQKYGDNACYKVEEVQEAPQNICPGLALQQKGPCLYQCCLQLPDFTVVSETFKRKKDAEQSAAEMALRKLGINPEMNTTDDASEQDPWDVLTNRIAYFFSTEFLSSQHPLSCHIRAALQREGDVCGLVPASAIASCDSKTYNLCKSINAKGGSNPFLVVLLIMMAAKRLSGSLSTATGQLWIRRQDPYPLETTESLVFKQSQTQDCISIKAINISCSLEKAVESIILDISSTSYYLDALAQRLGLTDASKVVISRTIGKASSETRLYFAAPKSDPLDVSLDLPNEREPGHYEHPINARASYISGQYVYGDAILASVGYKWKSEDLFHEDLSLETYYRMMLIKVPYGSYKISREAILMADLPIEFSTRANWRGDFPKELLSTFCRQHQLLEPVYSISPTPKEFSESYKKLKFTDSIEKEADSGNGNGNAANKRDSTGSGGTFHCAIKIFSRSQDLLIECSPEEYHKKQNDSVQNASLKVVSWLNEYLKDLDMPLEKLSALAKVYGIKFYLEKFFREFAPCRSVLEWKCKKPKEYGVRSLKINGPECGTVPSNGSILSINYAVSLVTGNGDKKEIVEKCDEFEFEMGVGAVIPPVEAAVAQMNINQVATLVIDLPHQELVLAAADNSKIQNLLSLEACYLEYYITLLRAMEPVEDRMEQALFSPPLSKQRVEYALQHIRKSGATSLVDFGCGSGSLLESLLDYPTALEKIVGVDISQKGLGRAAKSLHSKLRINTAADGPSKAIKLVVLYEGSITNFDSRLYGFDIGTCIEVIEHMEEAQACLFGDIVLSSFCPKILIVSTPNYEYNAILQKFDMAKYDDDPDDKTQQQSRRFRNHDHKFEWTREQFNNWAQDLAARHSYSVEFSGVGGSADVEPGFASQIAVFKRGVLHQEEEDKLKDAEPAHCYNVIWEWNNCNI